MYSRSWKVLYKDMLSGNAAVVVTINWQATEKKKQVNKFEVVF